MLLIGSHLFRLCEWERVRCCLPASSSLSVASVWEWGSSCFTLHILSLSVQIEIPSAAWWMERAATWVDWMLARSLHDRDRKRFIAFPRCRIVFPLPSRITTPARGADDWLRGFLFRFFFPVFNDNPVCWIGCSRCYSLTTLPQPWFNIESNLFCEILLSRMINNLIHLLHCSITWGVGSHCWRFSGLNGGVSTATEGG